MQNIINSPDFQNNEKYPVQEKKKIYASIYATRMAVNALPGKAKTLDVSVPQDYFNSYLDQMMKSTAFEEFIQQNGHQRIQQLATNGHGGIAEREFRTFVARRSKLDPTVPGRYMPSARGRIDTLKTNLLSMQPTSEEAITAYSEIFRARRSVGAIHGKNVKTTLPLIIGGGASANYAQVPDLSQSNTILYGHHMNNGSMFASLADYKKEGYLEDHPVLYYYTPDQIYMLEVFACFITGPDSDVYTFNFTSPEEFENYLESWRSRSNSDTDVEVNGKDHIMTLSTCTYEYEDARYVVMGKIVPM